jgi:hypothetical protein
MAHHTTPVSPAEGRREPTSFAAVAIAATV